MKFGVYIPNYGDYSDVARIVQLARETEESGWDGFFVWDTLVMDKSAAPPLVDTWIALAAIAASTSRLIIGPLITPIARRRPWKVARECLSLDHLSKGRAILGVGLGAPANVEFEALGEDPDDKVRASKLDEGLDVIVGLWSGEPFRYMGKFFSIDGVRFLPKPVQKPRVPIWVAGMLPSKKPFRRAAKWDGVFPLKMPAEGLSGSSTWESLWLSPTEMQEVIAYIDRHRIRTGPFEVIATGATSAVERDKAAVAVTLFEKAGATWWLEWVDDQRGSFEEMRERILAGPPKV